MQNYLLILPSAFCIPMKPPLERLFQRRLLFVAGKGGVGKTTVACALAMIATQLGKRTLLTEVDGAGRAAYLLGVEPAPLGLPQRVGPSLSVMSIEGSAALAEYLQIILPVKRVLQAVFASRIYRYFVAAAPGLKELLTVGKIWYEAERVDETSGSRLWDLVVVDAPATGHSLQYLRMPHAAHQAFGSGLVGRESKRIIDLLGDPHTTAISLVTTPEEMPVNETVEMYQQIRGNLHMPLGVLFVNRMHRAAFDEKKLDTLERKLAKVHDARERAIATEVLNRGREEAGWTHINQRYVQRLAAEIDMPRVEIPFVFAEEFGLREVHAIAADIVAENAALSHRGMVRGRA
jgi:anion-transporting  ArsA/GET3 family ATPase